MLFSLTAKQHSTEPTNRRGLTQPVELADVVGSCLALKGSERGVDRRDLNAHLGVQIADRVVGDFLTTMPVIGTS